MASFGTVSWPFDNPLWTFSYGLSGPSQPEGLVLRQVHYKGKKVLWKISLPSLRVQYDRNQCGPYKDPLSSANARPLDNGELVWVYQYAIPFVPMPFLAVDSYYEIGAYRLRQRYLFSTTGDMVAELHSAGLQCNLNHRHHAYWRMDFDISGADSDSVYQHTAGAPDIGHGAGWAKFRAETSVARPGGIETRWAIKDRNAPERGYFIRPGHYDGLADAFARRDAAFTRYRGSEDRQGNQGNAWDDGIDADINGEGINRTDVVMWYCGHLGHAAQDGADEWHSAGPRLTPFNWG